MTLSTHVLDTGRGRPAAGVPIRLDRHDGETWRPLAENVTDADGRLGDLPAPDAGTYRLRFGTGPYFAAHGTETFYPEVSVVFVVSDPGEHHHVPLLVSAYGYSTYRGS
ncbi:hydroxyisourate hydrolase [Actinomadura sp. HBU206391]|uniref:hydroxyisourate hydrolase n=1 Tax=Actinomadura sp. HBU206391 TaxID=2731692 RepID=UPI001650476A|nr:hydroxyisourate hydrolase [Actinomadura sp. HBU206391]MBC6461854.1 hydroxyisourate hydrolase [Actinomadura sp. HBU206391]